MENDFLIVWRLEVHIKVPASSVSAMGSLPDLQTAFLSMASHGLSSVHGPQRERERERERERGRGRGREREKKRERAIDWGGVLSSISSYGILILLNQDPSLMTSSNLDSLASHLQTQPHLHWGQGFNIWIWGEHKHSVHKIWQWKAVLSLYIILLKSIWY